jgi:hypothetical protein
MFEFIMLATFLTISLSQLLPEPTDNTPSVQDSVADAPRPVRTQKPSAKQTAGPGTRRAEARSAGNLVTCFSRHQP